LPLQFGIITAPDTTKKQGALDIAKILDVPIENFLAVGDSTSDWKFMKICGFVAAMGNASDELKELVITKDNKGYIGESVDENGIIEILNWYLRV
jgi:hydroxymethylpyrimidine pyrophosphatase-like HAD family hydrolase